MRDVGLRWGIAWPTVALVMLACTGLQEPAVLGEQVLVAGGDSARLVVVDVAQARVLTSLGPVPRYQDAWVRSRDSAVLYVSAFDQIPSRQLMAIDVISGRVLWQEAVAAIALRSRIGPISIFGDYALSMPPDGARLLLADAQRDSVLGIAVLDAATRDPVTFVGPMAVAPGGMAFLPPSTTAPGGTVLVAGSRQDASTSTGQLFVLDGVTLAVRDSVALTTNARRGGLSQIVVAPDRVHVYVVGINQLFRYDLKTHAVTATGPRLGTGRLAIGPDGRRLFLTDAGDGRDSPGSGKIFVYDAALTPLVPIDLSASGGVPVSTNLVVSRTGERLYVLAGTPQYGPLFGPQLGRVLVVDAQSGGLAGAVPLGEYGVQWIFLR